jgi:hypothetical protein
VLNLPNLATAVILALPIKRRDSASLSKLQAFQGFILGDLSWILGKVRALYTILFTFESNLRNGISIDDSPLVLRVSVLVLYH